jgi:TonB-linked SusC/RagA family outer membrane protein
MINYDFPPRRKKVLPIVGFSQCIRIMKLTSILLVIFCMHLSAATKSQTLTIHAKDRTLASVFRDIKKQTQLAVVYNDRFVNGQTKVSIVVEQAPLTETLKTLLTPLSLTYHITENTIVITPSSSSKSEDVTATAVPIQDELRGIVLDVTGQPIPGVAVTWLGSNVATQTDEQGRYSIRKIPGHLILVFTSLGFQEERVTVNDQKEINAVLRETSVVLDDIVIVGFGQQKKESVTGAISTVNMQTINTASTPQLGGVMGGAIPGIISRQAGGIPGIDVADIFIRGISTFGSNRRPLILIDGVERNINNINIQEVESISTLKDASATAVYGVRGANGVIMIKTKSGEKGKAKVSFRSEWAQLQGIRFPNYINGYEYAVLMNEGQQNVGVSSNNLRWQPNELEKFKDQSDPYLYPDVNWVDEVFNKTSQQTINNLSVSGGNELVRYFMNVGYTLQGGLIKRDPEYEYNTSSDFHRYNFRSNIDLNISKNFIVDLGIGGILSEGKHSGTAPWDIYENTKWIAPLAYPVRNPDGSFGGGTSGQSNNPYAFATQSGYGLDVGNTLQVTVGAKWKLDDLLKTPGFTYGARLSYDYAYTRGTVRQKGFLGQSYSRDPVTGEDKYVVVRPESPMGFGHWDNGNRAYYWETSLNYDRTFGSHHLGAMALFNRRDYVVMTVNESNAAAASIANLPYRHQGLAGRLIYDYANKYLLEFNMGYNGSENFPKGSQYGFFPSVSAGWIATNESFWQFDPINHLKIRGSYGQVGNDQIGGDRFLFITSVGRINGVYRYGETQSYVVNGFREDKVGLNNVTWEVADKANVGLDVEMFKNKFVFQADVFYEKRKNILLRRQIIPAYSGFEGGIVPWGNLGVVENRGVDAMMEYRNLNPSGLSFSLYVNGSFARNKILENDEPEPPRPYLTRIGLPVDQPFGLEAIGLFKDQADIDNSPEQTFTSVVRPGDIKYKDQDGDGKITAYDEVPLGYTRLPEMMLGFGGRMDVKGIVDFSLHFTGATRTSTFVGGMGMHPFSQGFGMGNVYREFYDNRFIPGQANDQAKYPAVVDGPNENNFRQSSFYLRDASYIRLKTAELGFKLKPNSLQRLNLQQARLFINGMNLLTFDKLKFIDPEVNYGTGGYPQQRTINLGVQVNF